MPTIRVDEISKYDGQEVTVQGWVYNRTDKGKLVFLLVRDGTGFVQCVAFKGNINEKLFDQVIRLPQEFGGCYQRGSSVPISAHPEYPADRDRALRYRDRGSLTVTLAPTLTVGSGNRGQGRRGIADR